MAASLLLKASLYCLIKIKCEWQSVGYPAAVPQLDIQKRLLYPLDTAAFVYGISIIISPVLL